MENLPKLNVNLGHIQVKIINGFNNNYRYENHIVYDYIIKASNNCSGIYIHVGVVETYDILWKKN